MNSQSEKTNLRKASNGTGTGGLGTNVYPNSPGSRPSYPVGGRSPPGPYIESPNQELDQNGDDGDILFNGDLIEDDDIPDLNLEDDDQCLSNF